MGAAVGGALSLAGSVLGAYYSASVTEAKNQGRAEQNLLFEIEDDLLSYEGMQRRRFEGPTPDKAAPGSIELLIKLYTHSARLSSKSNVGFASEIHDFCNRESPEQIRALRERVTRA